MRALAISDAKQQVEIDSVQHPDPVIASPLSQFGYRQYLNIKAMYFRWMVVNLLDVFGSRLSHCPIFTILCRDSTSEFIS